METEITDRDRAEIRRLVELYALAMDENDLDAFPRLFVADGALLVMAPGRERPLGEFRGPGPDGVALIAILMNDLYQATLHNITTHQVTQSEGDRASGVTYTLAYHVIAGQGNGALETLGVRYEDEFVRTPDGWRIGVRRATRLWSQTTATPPHPLLVDRAAGKAVRSAT